MSLLISMEQVVRRGLFLSLRYFNVIAIAFETSRLIQAVLKAVSAVSSQHRLLDVPFVAAPQLNVIMDIA